MLRIGVPDTMRGIFQGSARAFQASLASQPWLILAALVTVYIVLGVLYESYVHPITILSTLPSAGVGALLALMLFHTDFTIIAFIGVILLIGIVKKNAIMMIDFALDAERTRELCHARRDLRGLPAALPPDHDDDDGGDAGRACRWRSARATAPRCAGRSASPSSAACIVSQMLTLYTTPVVYLYLDRFRLWATARRGRIRARAQRWRRHEAATHARWRRRSHA